MNKYKATNVGGLMIEDSIRIFKFIHGVESNLVSDSDIELILPVKSESSRKRIFQEIKRRYSVLDQKIVDYFVDAEQNNQSVILFYAALKSYKLLSDIVFELLIPKFSKGEGIVDKMDILSFLDTKEEEQSHIENWSIRTRKNMAGVMLMMLKEAKIQNKKQISPIMASDELWVLFASVGDYWMLEAALMNKDERQRFL